MCLPTPPSWLEASALIFINSFLGQNFTVVLRQIQCVLNLSIHFITAQPGIVIGDSDGQLCCSFHNGFVVL